MAEKIELLISAKNAANGALKDARADVRNLENQVRKATDALEQTGEGRREVDKLVEKLGQARVEAKRWALVQKDAAQELDKATNATQRNRRETDRLNRSHSKASKGGSTFAAGWGKVAGVAAGVTAAIAGLSGAFTFLSSSVNEARQARKAAAQTVAVMRSMGRTEAPAALEKMIDHLESISGIDGDNIREMTNVMLTFGNVQGKTLTRANKLALDLSVAFGKDLQSSAVMVGKALNDPLKGLTALSRIGVQFTGQQQEQIKAMVAVGDQAGAQKIIMAELARQVGGSAKAQADGIGKTSVAWGNLKEAIGETIMSSSTGWDLAGKLKEATAWIQNNKQQIVSVLQKIISVTFKVISAWLKWQSVSLTVMADIVGGVSNVISAMAILDPRLKGTAEKVNNVAVGMRSAAKGASDASEYFNDLATSADNASTRSKALAEALKGIKSKKVRLQLETTYESTSTAVPAYILNGNSGGSTKKGRKDKGTGDTPTPRAHGALMSGGLAAAHSMLNAGIPGRRTITSGLRWHDLGSPGSDHARGRALDLTGPGLSAYAARVRRGGGFAQFHGSGPDRHLHAVPAGGGVTEVHNHFTANVHNPSSTVDVKAAFRQMAAEAEAERRRRGPGRGF